MELELEMAKVNSCLPYLSSLSIYFISPQIDKKKKKRKIYRLLNLLQYFKTISFLSSSNFIESSWVIRYLSIMQKGSTFVITNSLTPKSTLDRNTNLIMYIFRRRESIVEQILISKHACIFHILASIILIFQLTGKKRRRDNGNRN